MGYNWHFLVKNSLENHKNVQKLPILANFEATLVKFDLKIKFLAQKYIRNHPDFIILLLKSKVDTHFQHTEESGATVIFMNTFPNISELSQHAEVYNTIF